MQMATGRPDILLLFATTSAAVLAATALTVWGGFRYIGAKLKDRSQTLLPNTM
jgi:hypothetical protein